MNRLASELSPYLLQHAHNPVDWFPWGEDAFQKARNEKKPIFLSIGYSACYWCHVMERESFMDKQVAELLNQNFISIKVDREEHPDIDEIYMKSVEIISGQGGWPMSVFLTPDLKPFFAGTYYPKPNFLQLLQTISIAWINQPQAILSDAEKITTMIQSLSHLPETLETEAPSLLLLSQAAEEYHKIFDDEFGGFGGAPKFPQPSVLNLLMANYQANNNQTSLEIAEKTLDAMARGGIYDQVGGGFHRYATDTKWRIPHFEKMLYDNAQLIRTYTKAYLLTKKVEFKRIVDDIIQYVMREMANTKGLFYSSQDAEIEGEEGKFYRFSKEELEDNLTPDEFALVKTVYGVSNPPNFEGYYVLYWPNGFDETARQENINQEQLIERLAPIRQKLLRVRQQKPKPLLDDKIITAWNGLMIEALAYAGMQFNNSEYIELAKSAADSLLIALSDQNGDLLHITRNGKAKLEAFLDDYATVILGLLAVAQASKQSHYSDIAVNLADKMIQKFWNPRGDFYYASISVDNLLTRHQYPFDGAMPSGNSLAARALSELVKQGFLRFTVYAASLFQVYTGLLKKSPKAFPAMLWGLYTFHQTALTHHFINKSSDVIIVKTEPAQFELPLHQPFPFQIELTIKENWHIYANQMKQSFVTQTHVTALIGKGECELTVDYPRGIEEIIGTDKLLLYKNQLRLPASLLITKLPSGMIKSEIALTLYFQACDNKGVCLLPDTLTLTIPFIIADK